MLAALKRLAARLGSGSAEAGGTRLDRRSVDNVDGIAAAGMQRPDAESDHTGSAAYPPGYVKSYDEGRPRK